MRWCNPGECSGMGGAMFLYGSRVIAIDPQWPFKDNEVLLTMEHEYGHALGLPASVWELNHEGQDGIRRSHRGRQRRILAT